MRKNLFVLALDGFNRRVFEELEERTDYRFHELLDYDTVAAHSADVEALLDLARERLARFGAPIAGIVAYWDFPVQTVAPMLRTPLGLPTPSLESTLRCEHKYWSRLEQRKVAPEMVPEFQAFDPLASDARSRVTLPFPFWIKPIKATNSELAFLVENEADFTRALDQARQRIPEMAGPVDQVLSHADLPDEVCWVTGNHMIAEGMMHGQQSTVSGWVHDGEVHVYGVVDSLNYPGTSSFSRYQYPSALPSSVQERMATSARKVIDQIGYDQQAFNMEFFYDADADGLWILEINPRISQSHGDIYEKVDGEPNHRIMADLSVGRRPDFPHRQGRFPLAAKFYLRRFRDGTVVRAPGQHEVERIQRAIPGAVIDVRVREGARLSDLEKQDSYSFEVAHIYLGGDTEEGLLALYERCVEELDIRIDE